VFREGALVTALRCGHWVVLDELNLAPTEVLEALNRCGSRSYCQLTLSLVHAAVVPVWCGHTVMLHRLDCWVGCVSCAPVNPSCPGVATAAGVSDGAHSTQQGKIR
jgi:hypothetical protein